MWTTQRRLCPSATTHSLRLLPALRCARPLRKCGGSCDKQVMDYSLDSRLHFFHWTKNGFTRNMAAKVFSRLRPCGLLCWFGHLVGYTVHVHSFLYHIFLFRCFLQLLIVVSNSRSYGSQYRSIKYTVE